MLATATDPMRAPKRALTMPMAGAASIGLSCIAGIGAATPREPETERVRLAPSIIQDVLAGALRPSGPGAERRQSS